MQRFLINFEILIYYKRITKIIITNNITVSHNCFLNRARFLFKISVLRLVAVTSQVLGKSGKSNTVQSLTLTMSTHTV